MRYPIFPHLSLSALLLCAVLAACGSSDSPGSPDASPKDGEEGDPQKQEKLESICTAQLALDDSLKQSTCADEFDFDPDLSQASCVEGLQDCSTNGVELMEELVGCYGELPPCTAENLNDWMDELSYCQGEVGMMYIDMECSPDYREASCAVLATLSSDPLQVWDECDASPADFPPLSRSIPSDTKSCVELLEGSSFECRKAVAGLLDCIDLTELLICGGDFYDTWRNQALQCWSLLADMEKLPNCLVSSK